MGGDEKIGKAMCTDDFFYYLDADDDMIQWCERRFGPGVPCTATMPFVISYFTNLTGPTPTRAGFMTMKLMLLFTWVSSMPHA